MLTLYSKYNIKIELDETEIFPYNPGDGTPCMVIHDKGDTGTYWCCLDTGFVDDMELNPKQMQWLVEQKDIVEDWLNTNTSLIIAEEELLRIQDRDKDVPQM